jgi:5-methylthioadenosine/S-adenosylhomocysteine deaminase
MSKIKIINALVLTMDRRNRILNNITIMIENDKIVDISRTADDNSKQRSEKRDDIDVIDASGMIVMPGLVNCHVHTVQTLFRGVASDGLGLLPWLQEYIYPMESVMDREEVYVSSLLAIEPKSIDFRESFTNIKDLNLFCLSCFLLIVTNFT